MPDRLPLVPTWISGKTDSNVVSPAIYRAAKVSFDPTSEKRTCAKAGNRQADLCILVILGKGRAQKPHQLKRVKKSRHIYTKENYNEDVISTTPKERIVTYDGSQTRPRSISSSCSILLAAPVEGQGSSHPIKLMAV